MLAALPGSQPSLDRNKGFNMPSLVRFASGRIGCGSEWYRCTLEVLGRLCAGRMRTGDVDRENTCGFATG